MAVASTKGACAEFCVGAEVPGECTSGWSICPEV